jgi:fluoride exporter
MGALIGIAAGGAAGALLRFFMSAAVTRFAGSDFPWGTLAVNVLGAFVMGVLVELMALKITVSSEWRAFLTICLLGGFTTFSAFSLESVLMLQKGEWIAAGAYMIGSVVLCVGALFLGLWMVRIWP